jgi:hypothetical protein
MNCCDEVLGFRDASGSTVEPPPAAETIETRLARMTMPELVGAWREDRPPGPPPPDFASIPLDELAAARVEVRCRSDLERERDSIWHAMFDLQYELTCNDPLSALELVTAILRIEGNPVVLGLLVAGMLEDLIPEDDGPGVDAVVAAAARDPKLREILGGLWSYGINPEVTERLQEARGGVLG